LKKMPSLSFGSDGIHLATLWRDVTAFPWERGEEVVLKGSPLGLDLAVKRARQSLPVAWVCSPREICENATSIAHVGTYYTRILSSFEEMEIVK
jgi:hypothetical protein